MYPKQPFSPTTTYRIAATILLIFTIYSCANMSRPTGGPYDEAAPIFIQSNPAPGALNVSKPKIELAFNEIVVVEKVSEKVVVSPPQKNMPEIRASGRKVHVNLKDTLIPNTTYTIDFSDAIADNNERNPLYNFAYSFSTGNVIDSLQISGIVLDATNLEPITGMLVGVYSNLSDTAFQTLPLERIARSNALGHFTIRNLAPGQYRLVALGDMNRDYRFDNPSENIAFLDTLITPWCEVKLHTDTLWLDSDSVAIDPTLAQSLSRDSLAIDTIIQYNHTHYYPNNILLSAFNEGFQNQYLDKSERKERRRIDLYFKAPADSLPQLTPLNFDQKDWAILERTQHNDTLSYWIKDSTIYKMDTLIFAANYLRTDSLRQLSPYNDTLKFIMKAPKNKKKDKEKEVAVHTHDSIPTDSVAPPQIEFLKITPNSSNSLDIYSPLRYTFPEPIAHYDPGMIHLELKQDTLWIPIADSLFTFKQDSIALRNYTLSHKWAPGASYRVTIDSTAFTGIYGLFTNKYTGEFKIKSLEEYANLYLNITGVTDSAIVELLNTSDIPIRTAPLHNGGAEFMYLTPGTYYARLYIDTNHNGKYDTGNYAQKQQPEEVSYLPQELELKANWDIEQEWDIYATPVDKQKPEKIKKNKPKEQTKKRRDR